MPGNEQPIIETKKSEKKNKTNDTPKPFSEWLICQIRIGFTTSGDDKMWVVYGKEIMWAHTRKWIQLNGRNKICARNDLNNNNWIMSKKYIIIISRLRIQHVRDKAGQRKTKQPMGQRSRDDKLCRQKSIAWKAKVLLFQSQNVRLRSRP